ncbi:NUDIX domain-containing protein [Gorillibacterium timonense]|uniref:NUDIX domain-containing protein n=1 Tax=Gorillibacterium timonense TaxID=1689269 RepID=UPI00071E4204|nr:NUDIX domain-containing protein [Gorillibacterium timonense]
MRLRLMAVNLLFQGNDLLLMKRAPERLLLPGMWGAVGGHVEPQELCDPLAACLRETEEETGFRATDLRDIRLQYILLRQKEDELRQQFFFTSYTDRRDFTDTREGTLHWIPREEVLKEEREMAFVFRSLLTHFFANGPSSNPWVGTAGWPDLESQGQERPSVIWTPLLDPLVL